MSALNPELSREDVLEEFSFEPKQDQETLDRYISAYPAYAADLIELSDHFAELEPNVDEGPLTVEETEAIEHSWNAYRSATGKQPDNPFEALTVDQRRDAARTLGIRRQVLTRLIEGSIVWEGIPSKFRTKLAEVFQTTQDALERHFTGSTRQLTHSYKASIVPAEEAKVPFEDALRDALMSEDEISRILRSED